MGKSGFMIMDSTRICPVCQKEFVAYDDWVYKCQFKAKTQYMIWFCSWGCYRKYEKGETDINGRGIRLSEKKRQIWKALDDGLTVKEICALLDVTPKSVSYYKSKWVPKGDDHE
jgi:hypothetical protein